MVKAIEYDLQAIIKANKNYNCGKIEGNDCVPIFKGTSHSAIVEANGGSVPSELAFIAVSKDAGEIIESSSENFSAGENVIATGYKMGMAEFGGFGEIVHLPDNWVIKMPKNFLYMMQ